jgi:hypothetical protein
MNEWKECDFENYPEYCHGCILYTESKLDNLDCEVIEKMNSSHIYKCPCADCLLKMKCIGVGCSDFDKAFFASIKNYKLNQRGKR